MKITQSVEIASNNYVLFAGNHRIFVDDSCFYSEDNQRIPYTDTQQLLEWNLWTHKRALTKLLNADKILT